MCDLALSITEKAGGLITSNQNYQRGKPLHKECPLRSPNSHCDLRLIVSLTLRNRKLRLGGGRFNSPQTCYSKRTSHSRKSASLRSSQPLEKRAFSSVTRGLCCQGAERSMVCGTSAAARSCRGVGRMQNGVVVSKMGRGRGPRQKLANWGAYVLSVSPSFPTSLP